MDTYNQLKKNFFFIIGTNVIESEEHVLMIANRLKNIFKKFNKKFIFKVSWDKANRSSLESYRGIDINKAVEIFKNLKKLGLTVLTDVHESYQVDILKDYVDIFQVPAFLARQTDLLLAVGKSDKIIHIKKGQFMNSSTMLKARDKVFSTGNKKVILCERGNMFGYNDLIVDSRNLIRMNTDDNLVTMDITHCLQQPSLTKNGIVKAGGLREYIKDMGKLAIAFDCHGIFMEVHNNPDEALCDGPTQFYLDQVENIIKYFYTLKNSLKKIKCTSQNKTICFIPARLKSTRLPYKLLKKIDGLSVISRVIRQAKKCNNIDKIIVLTDSDEIKKEVESNNSMVECYIIKKECKNGTDRIVKYLESSSIDYSNDLILNVQGDEPYINPDSIDKCIENMKYRCLDSEIVCSTLIFKIDKELEHPKSRSIGKVICDKNNNILYCSRNVIPGTKGHYFNENFKYHGHVGVFVYRYDYLLNHYSDNKNSSLQKSEDIEWLKILQDSYKINAVLVEKPERSVDTLDDLNFLKNKYEN